MCLFFGGRDFADIKLAHKTLDLMLLFDDRDFTIVQGGATGADYIAKQWAIDHKIDQVEFLADWKKYRKAAGPIRNKEMLAFLLAKRDDGYKVMYIAFPGGDGTANMQTQLNTAGIKGIIVNESGSRTIATPV